MDNIWTNQQNHGWVSIGTFLSAWKEERVYGYTKGIPWEMPCKSQEIIIIAGQGQCSSCPVEELGIHRVIPIHSQSQSKILKTKGGIRNNLFCLNRVCKGSLQSRLGCEYWTHPFWKLHQQLHIPILFTGCTPLPAYLPTSAYHSRELKN